MMRSATVVVLAVLGAFLAGCGDKPQTAATKKSDAHPWEGGQAAYTEKGWKPGDEASWDSQMRARAQAQNEYARAPAK